MTIAVIGSPPVHSKKPNGRRYRYYISARLAKGEMDDGTALRLPAKQIEGHVIRRLTGLLSNTGQMMGMANNPEVTPQQVSKLEQHASALSARLISNCIETQRTHMIDLIRRITISPKELTLELRRDALLPDCVLPQTTKTEDVTITLTYPLQMKRRGVETKLIIGGAALGQPDLELIKLIAKARDWYDGLKTGRFKSIKDIAANENMDKGDLSRTLTLAFLAPSIIKDILNGQHPVDLTMDKLRRKSSRLPQKWNEQRKYLGFAA